MKMKNCTAIVTGGASGLGEATVRRIIGAGGNAGILDLDETRGQALVDELGDKVTFFKTNVTDTPSVTAAVNGTAAKYGGLHIAVNCAGLGIPMKVLSKKGPLPIEKFELVIRVNLIGTMNVMRLAAEKMTENTPAADNEKGVIINTSSTAAYDGQIGQAAYASSKAAIIGLTLPVAREFADYGIRVMTIAPGLFDTPILDAIPPEFKQALADSVPFPKRLGYPDEFAMLVEQIVGNPMFNGETIRLDGCIRMAAK
ncbi:NAD(P)-dependent dehydrogenase, short-chain alcohol dehydrogenase family [Desulfocicer vacuolatum DSM 3385]|uniref:NAD(P)-dependent dehydrogenase, short-chain alcohol dehydrogenase family n=1 Tax=Desulfocicer vacuolatum DSM 3385 TaxID=1121400 RepID=A0A1W2CWN3_9BACT|nr:SDR family NAD(P)-dependent oxidoreductase [Desulfocicer vacuolatum]SMC89649.1 NAD(P)-dependent dehydrogenase, short-chain alcohol dehydrogenase family [Desulfocicer vacuolatum DSM 3385]